MPTTARGRLLALARRRGVITARDAARAGIHSQQLTRLVSDGALQRITRGHYRLTTRPITENHALAVVARAVPRGVMCLLSALGFHEIGTQLPSDVWVAIERGARQPAFQDPPLRVVRLTGRRFPKGSKPIASKERRSAYSASPRRWPTSSNIGATSVWTSRSKPCGKPGESGSSRWRHWTGPPVSAASNASCVLTSKRWSDEHRAGAVGPDAPGAPR